MRAEEREKLWDAFYDAARHNDALDERTTLMLHLAVAMALGCHP